MCAGRYQPLVVALADDVWAARRRVGTFRAVDAMEAEAAIERRTKAEVRRSDGAAGGVSRHRDSRSEAATGSSTGHYAVRRNRLGEFQRVVAGDGPCNRQRLAHHMRAHDDGAWVREATRAINAKRAVRDARRPYRDDGRCGCIEVFIRSKRGLIIATSAACTRRIPRKRSNTRATFTRGAVEGVSIWVVKSSDIVASQEGDSEASTIRRTTNHIGTQRFIKCRTK